jgi:hypothetical protein
MKQFIPTYLYIKTHNKTGLKYFGKTSNDPYYYYGSGKHWIAHLKKHGYDISTEIIGYYTDAEKCSAAAREFSLTNNIVESSDWANLIIENGLDGGATTFGPRSDETKKKISENQKGKKLSLDHAEKCREVLKSLPKRKKGEYTTSKETKQKLREANLGKKLAEETRKKMSESRKGKSRPEASEWMKKRIVSDETRKKMSESQKGKIVKSETKEKIRLARSKQVITNETKDKLKGKIVVIDKDGNITKILKETFYDQQGPDEDKIWVFHKSKEGIKRKMRRSNAVPIFSDQEAVEISTMRRG